MKKLLINIVIIWSFTSTTIHSQNCIEQNEVNFGMSKKEYEHKFNVTGESRRQDEIGLFNADTLTELYTPLRHYTILFDDKDNVDTICIRLLDMSSFGFYNTDAFFQYTKNYFNMFYGCVTELQNKLNIISTSPQTWYQGKYKFELYYKESDNSYLIYLTITSK
ncbi:MAG: hypothetical protein IPJ54_16815 [Saprospiraceae bacterium]|nr:hypothetical protein [Saprospiraceae bacterium]